MGQEGPGPVMPPPPYSGCPHALCPPGMLMVIYIEQQGLRSYMAVLGGKCCQHPRFIEEETEAWRGELTCFRTSPQPPTPSQQTTVPIDYSPLSYFWGGLPTTLS